MRGVLQTNMRMGAERLPAGERRASLDVCMAQHAHLGWQALAVANTHPVVPMLNGSGKYGGAWRARGGKGGGV